MRNIALKRWVSAMLLLLMPWVAGAAGLGRLVILSPLGQPLNAEIDLVAVEKEELATLAVRLASAEAYKQANLQYSPVLSGVRLGIEKRPNGEPYIKIVSARPVNEAFIDLLVELSWATGRIVREYTALIDPPGFAPEPAAPAAAVAVPETRPAPALPPAAATPVAPARKTAVAAAPRAKDYGPIQRGETLSAIARSVKPEGITLEQMLVSLYRSNPDAFINDNMNLVKSGKILRVPANDEVMAVTPQQAVKEVRLHAADWNAYRRKLAAAALAARESSTAAAGKITVRAEDKSAAKEAKDVVRLSKGEPPASGGAAAGEMAGRLRTLEEEAVAREKALREANERIARLEKTIQDMQRLLEIKSAGMAAAQQKAESAASAPEAPSAVKPEAGARPEPAPATATAALEAKKEEAPAAAAPADKPAAPEKAEQPQPKPKAVPPPLPPEPGFIDTLLDEPLYLAAAGGVIVLGGLALWMARRRRAAPAAAAAREPVEPSSPPPARDVAGSPELAAAAAVAAAAAPATIAAEATADEVDPLAEAEVYIAYGRDTQAEGILKEALAKNPGREDVRLKLLEIYAARPDKAAFNSGAGEFHELTGGQGESWQKVAAMGHTLDPGNPLYEAGKGASVAQPSPPAVAADLDFDLGLPPAAATATATDTLDAPAARTDQGAPQPAAMSAAEEGEAKPGEAGKDEAAPPLPDFTLDVAAAASTAPAEVTSDASPPADSNTIDFNIELPKIEAPADAAPAGQLAAQETPTEEIQDAEAKPDFKIDIGGIDLNLDEPPQSAFVAEAEKDAHWYDVQTKFDLARAYQEMGDRDGAREILQEVLKEGDAQQQAEAKSLLETIG